MVKPIINIFRTLEEALAIKDSQLNRFYRHNGVHLLPNNLDSYIQVTDTPLGLNLEDWTVKGVYVCGGAEQDITASFNIESFTNSDNGNPQLIWSLTNVPIDFGYKMIYLKISQAVGETFYSQPFILSNFQKEKTTMFHYKERVGDAYQSIGFKSWFRQETETIELTTYYELSTQNTVTEAIKVNEYEIHQTEFMSIDNLKKLSLVLRSPYLYLAYERAYLFQAMEMPKLTASENFAKVEFNVTVDENDIYGGATSVVSAAKGDFLSTDFLSTDFNIYI